MITSTITNNYKFIGMERDFEGNAPLDHTLYREYAPNLARWTTPDPVHGTPANPQSWNRYPYVLNDPLTRIDPLGLVGASIDPFTYTSFVGCRPSFEKLIGQFFGCGWDPDEELCPPGYVEIYGDPGLGGGIENINSLHDYADEILPWGNGYGDMYDYTNTSNGVDFWISSGWINSFLGSGTVGGDIRGTLSSFSQIIELQQYLSFLNSISEFQQTTREPGYWTKEKCDFWSNVALDGAIGGTYGSIALVVAGLPIPASVTIGIAILSLWLTLEIDANCKSLPKAIPGEDGLTEEEQLRAHGQLD